MIRILIPLLSFSLSTSALYNLPTDHPSAASDAQIRFAIENRYDDTGPGAKGPVYAYNTFGTLDEALIGYLDDPDTKLPDPERRKAVNLLIGKGNKEGEFQRYYPKTVEEYTGYNKVMPTPPPQSAIPFLFNKPRLQSPVVLTKLPPKKYLQNSKDIRGEIAEAYRLHKLAPIRANPLSLAHYTRDPEPDLQLPQDPQEFEPNPTKYTYSYRVHSADTGDSKSAKETLGGDGTVRGYYSFMDADGKLRLVRYTADDKLGFRATVDRT